jgi:hypothetical protein
MSTTTTFKRIALVTVAAMGFGVLSVAPSSAANYITPTTSLTAINTVVSSTPALLIPGSTVTVNYGATFGAYTIAANNDGSTVEHSFVGELIAYPASAYSQVVSTAAATPIAKTGTAAAVALSHLGGRGFLTATETATSGTGTAVWGFAAQTVTATATSGLGAFTFTAAKAGTYTLRIWSDNDQNNAISANEMVKTIDVTVATPSVYSNSYSTSVITNGTGTTPGASDVNVLAAKAISNANAGFITVTLKDATNTAMTAAAGTLQDVTAVRVTSSGVGFVAAETSAGVPISGSGPVAATCQTIANNAGGGVIGGLRTVTIAAANITSNVITFYACADNTGGFGEIKVEVISTSGGVQTLATEKASYYGDVTTLTKVLNTKGGNLGANWFALGGTTGTNANGGAFQIKATDVNGIAVPNLTLTSTSSNAAKWTTTPLTVVTPGTYPFSITTTTLAPNAAVAGDKPVFTIADSVVTTAKVDVTGTISGAAATVVMALDAGSYEQGDVATLTLTAKDALGNPVADLTSHAVLGANGLVSNIMLQGAAATSGGNVIPLPSVPGVTFGSADESTAAGTYVWKFFAPVSKNGFTISNSTGGAYVIASVSASYSNPELDAAQEALDAANAATDAANAATDAADAATAAAQDAADAVAALAVTTQAQIASLRLQNIALSKKITQLMALINKILNK